MSAAMAYSLFSSSDGTSDHSTHGLGDATKMVEDDLNMPCHSELAADYLVLSNIDMDEPITVPSAASQFVYDLSSEHTMSMSTASNSQLVSQDSRVVVAALPSSASTKSVAGASVNPNQRRNVYVSGLPSNLNASTFRELCQTYGRVEASKLCIDNNCSPTKGYGFALFCDEESAARCIMELNGKNYRGRNLQVRYADASATPMPTQGQAKPAGREPTRRPQPRGPRHDPATFRPPPTVVATSCDPTLMVPVWQSPVMSPSSLLSQSSSMHFETCSSHGAPSSALQSPMHFNSSASGFNSPHSSMASFNPGAQTQLVYYTPPTHTSPAPALPPPMYPLPPHVAASPAGVAPPLLYVPMYLPAGHVASSPPPAGATPHPAPQMMSVIDPNTGLPQLVQMV